YLSSPLVIEPSLFHLARYLPHLCLHSFPTRRSSDLESLRAAGVSALGQGRDGDLDDVSRLEGRRDLLRGLGVGGVGGVGEVDGRSEEHTSELQSRFDLVCRLLLEKKKSNVYQ